MASREAFFKIGVILATLNVWGTTPETMDLLSRAVKNGAMSLANSLISHVGAGSNPHDLFGALASSKRS